MNEIHNMIAMICIYLKHNTHAIVIDYVHFRPIPDIQQLIEYSEKISMDLTVANSKLEELKKRVSSH